MSSFRYLILTIIIFSLVSCRPSDDVKPILTSESTGLFAAGEIREEGQEDFSEFRIDHSNDSGRFTQTFWHGNVAASEFGTTFILNSFPSEEVTFTPLFGLRFWSDDLPNDRTWTALELEDFFAPGKTFDFGEGLGKVDVLLQLPLDTQDDFRASRSSYLPSPQGTLTVTEINDYDYPSYRFSSRQSYGKLIRCTFSGELGRYDREADQADGMINFFLTNEVVELRNGEVLFYVEYEVL